MLWLTIRLHGCSRVIEFCGHVRPTDLPSELHLLPQAAFVLEDFETAARTAGLLRVFVRSAVRQGNQNAAQHLCSLPWPIHPSIIGRMVDGLDKALQSLQPDALVAVLADCPFAELLQMSSPVRASAIAARCRVWPQVLDLRECLSPTLPGWQMDFAKNFLRLLCNEKHRKARRDDVVPNLAGPTMLSRGECRTSDILQQDLSGVTCLHLHNSDLNADLLQVLPSILPSLTALSHIVIDVPEAYRQLQLPELASNEEFGAPTYPWYHLAAEYPGMSTIGAEAVTAFKGTVATDAFVTLLECLPHHGQNLREVVLRGVSLHISGVDEWGPALGKLDQLEVLELDVISTGAHSEQHDGHRCYLCKLCCMFNPCNFKTSQPLPLKPGVEAFARELCKAC